MNFAFKLQKYQNKVKSFQKFFTLILLSEEISFKMEIRNLIERLNVKWVRKVKWRSPKRVQMLFEEVQFTQYSVKTLLLSSKIVKYYIKLN